MHRLYGITYDHNAMHMIRHDHKFIQFNTGVMTRDFTPAVRGYFTYRRKNHTPVHHAAKIRFAMFRADGDKIKSRIPVIPSFQAGRFDAIFIFEKGHG